MIPIALVDSRAVLHQLTPMSVGTMYTLVPRTSGNQRMGASQTGASAYSPKGGHPSCAQALCMGITGGHKRMVVCKNSEQNTHLRGSSMC